MCVARTAPIISRIPLPKSDWQHSPEKSAALPHSGTMTMTGILIFFSTTPINPQRSLRNEGGHRNHWLTLQPIGTQSNASGIGTKIVVKSGNLSLSKEVRSGASYLSQSDLRVHFGLEKNSAVDTLEIHWQSGLTERFSNVKSNQILRIKEGQGIINRQETR